MNTRTIRAFSAELQKIAADIQDADIQKLLAERRGKEYLDGGRLLTNTAFEAEYAQKLAYNYPRAGALSSGTSDVLGSKTKKDNKYQKARDYAGTATKGGLTGLGIMGAVNAMRGRFGAPSGHKAIRSAASSARRAAGAGASVAVLDRAYRHDELPSSHHEHPEKQAFVVSPNPNSTFRSPAASLSESRATGGFKSGIAHATGTAPKPVQLGQKFRLP